MLGEGWHNNKHFMSSARQGFFWWEVDFTYCILRALAWLGIFCDVAPPRARVARIAKVELLAMTPPFEAN